MPAAPPGSHVRSAPTCTMSWSMRCSVDAIVDLAHRLGELAVAHHEADGTDGEVTTDRVGAGVQPADGLHEERLRHRRQDLLRAQGTREEVQRAGADARR